MTGCYWANDSIQFDVIFIHFALCFCNFYKNNVYLREFQENHSGLFETCSSISLFHTNCLLSLKYIVSLHFVIKCLRLFVFFNNYHVSDFRYDMFLLFLNLHEKENVLCMCFCMDILCRAVSKKLDNRII